MNYPAYWHLLTCIYHSACYHKWLFLENWFVCSSGEYNFKIIIWSYNLLRYLWKTGTHLFLLLRCAKCCYLQVIKANVKIFASAVYYCIACVCACLHVYIYLAILILFHKFQIHTRDMMRTLRCCTMLDIVLSLAWNRKQQRS